MVHLTLLVSVNCLVNYRNTQRMVFASFLSIVVAAAGLGTI